jgi:hypothetical protein
MVGAGDGGFVSSTTSSAGDGKIVDTVKGKVEGTSVE